jgi:hypothetical protein
MGAGSSAQMAKAVGWRMVWWYNQKQMLPKLLNDIVPSISFQERRNPSLRSRIVEQARTQKSHQCVRTQESASRLSKATPSRAMKFAW